MRAFPHEGTTVHVPHGWVHRFGMSWLCGPSYARHRMRQLGPSSRPCVLCVAHLNDLVAHCESIRTELTEGTLFNDEK